MRKLYLLTIISIFCSLISNAQITKGSTWLGGSIGFYKNEQSNEQSLHSNSNFQFNPIIGKAFIQNSITGLELYYNQYKNENISFNSNFEDDKSRGYGIGIFGRKYGQLFKSFYIFGHAKISGGISKRNISSSINPEIKYKGWTAAASLYPGVSYALNKKIHLEAAFNNLIYFGYLTSKQESPINPIKSTQINGGIALENISGLSIGARFLL